MKSSNQQNLATVNKLLNLCEERFSHYQKIPDFFDNISSEITSFDYTPEQILLDETRLSWFVEHTNILTTESVVEIGSNLGFFCLSLAHQYGITVKGYEPIDAYAKAAQALADLAQLEARCNFFNRSICLNDIDDLPEADYLVHLNVLHHAGSVYDQEKVVSLGGWAQYATEYFSRLRKKFRYAFFQTGNMGKGTPWFDNNQTYQLLPGIFESAGWSVNKIGVIEDFNTLNYRTYTHDERSNIPLFNCRRNTETNLVEYLLEGKVIAKKPTGLAQRPLWLLN